MNNRIEIECPQWLKRAERDDFRRVLSIREASGRSVTAGEVDLIADYVLSRARIRDLRRAIGRQSASDVYRLDLYKQVERAIDQSRRLARDIGLESSPRSKAKLDSTRARSGRST